jgi:hypothetical protein
MSNLGCHGTHIVRGVRCKNPFYRTFLIDFSTILRVQPLTTNTHHVCVVYTASPVGRLTRQLSYFPPNSGGGPLSYAVAGAAATLKVDVGHDGGLGVDSHIAEVGDMCRGTIDRQRSWCTSTPAYLARVAIWGWPLEHPMYVPPVVLACRSMHHTHDTMQPLSTSTPHQCCVRHASTCVLKTCLLQRTL